MTAYRGRSVAYYGVLALGLLLIVAHIIPQLLPHRLATQIGHNSESLLFAFGLCTIIQFLLPWMQGRGWSPWRVTIPMAVLCFLIAAALLGSTLPSSVVTLNEPIIAIGLLALYVSIPRPLRFAPLITLAVAAFIVLFFNTSLVLDQAESLIPVLLAPLALDVFDRTILEPARKDRPGLRALWMALLVVLAIAFLLGARAVRPELDGPLDYAIDYGHRAAEAYWGWLLVHAYFGFWIGRDRGWSLPRIRAAAYVSDASEQAVH